MKSASELLEFLERELEILADTVEQRLCCVRVIAQALLGHPQMQREGDEALLGAVVKVALKSSALRDTRLENPCARGCQLIVCLRALKGERN